MEKRFGGRKEREDVTWKRKGTNNAGLESCVLVVVVVVVFFLQMHETVQDERERGTVLKNSQQAIFQIN